MLAVPVVDVDRHQVGEALLGLEVHLEADRLVGRNHGSRLADRGHRATEEDAVGHTDQRAWEIVVGEERDVEQRDDRLGARQRERAEPRTLPPGEDDGGYAFGVQGSASPISMTGIPNILVRVSIEL